jgi:dTDP-4-amino-4,6-dideoxygalactose transaminase
VFSRPINLLTPCCTHSITLQYQHYWADNSVSVTVTFKPEEAEQIKDTLEMYETRLKSDNIDKSLKIHYQIMLDSINEKIEKRQIFRKYFTQRLEKSTVCPSCHKEMSSHDTAQVIQCMRNFIKS